MVPLTMPGPPSKPVIELPGDRPTSPLTIVGPVFVTVLAPSTPYEAAVPRLTGPSRTVAADAALETPSVAAITRPLPVANARHERGEIVLAMGAACLRGRNTFGASLTPARSDRESRVEATRV